MWFAELTAGDSIEIGGVVVKLEEKSGKKARLSIDGDRDIAVTVNSASRKEILDKPNSIPLEVKTEIG
ncbi:hypothetical protein [Methylosinus sp. PW1]|uniref:hypothetical protein n=1 Tax=Methylosinus sp. PW1 TaxID=107636 RepID=UPI00055AA2D9|nr:hypothetical protein [Methylosinus sp. PW1]